MYTQNKFAPHVRLKCVTEPEIERRCHSGSSLPEHESYLRQDPGQAGGQNGCGPKAAGGQARVWVQSQGPKWCLAQLQSK